MEMKNTILNAITKKSSKEFSIKSVREQIEKEIAKDVIRKMKWKVVLTDFTPKTGPLLKLESRTIEGPLKTREVGYFISCTMWLGTVDKVRTKIY